MTLKEKIYHLLIELKHDNRTAYRVMKEAGEKIEELQKENERLAQIEKAFLGKNKKEIAYDLEVKYDTFRKMICKAKREGLL